MRITNSDYVLIAYVVTYYLSIFSLLVYIFRINVGILFKHLVAYGASFVLVRNDK
jgi:hypothetical protein